MLFSIHICVCVCQLINVYASHSTQTQSRNTAENERYIFRFVRREWEKNSQAKNWSSKVERLRVCVRERGTLYFLHQFQLSRHVESALLIHNFFFASPSPPPSSSTSIFVVCVRCGSECVIKWMNEWIYAGNTRFRTHIARARDRDQSETRYSTIK